VACSRLSGHIQPSKRVYFTLQRSGIKLVRPLSTVNNTCDYARVSHSRQWSNYNLIVLHVEAAATINTAMTLSTLSTSPLEEVSEACGKTAHFLQLYVCSDHEASRRLVIRAERAGYSAVFLTVDVPVFGKRRAQYYNPCSLPSHLQSVLLFAHS